MSNAPGRHDYLDEIDPNLLERTIEAAVEAKESAIFETTSVGVALATYDEEIFQGCNFENYCKKTIHAEEVALHSGLFAKYRGTDFWFMVQNYQSGRHEKLEVYPACLHCVAWLWEYTHPDLIIVNAKSDGNVVHTTKLKDLLSFEPPEQIYPSSTIKKMKKLNNFHPKLVNGESPYYKQHYDDDGDPLF